MSRSTEVERQPDKTHVKIFKAGQGEKENYEGLYPLFGFAEWCGFILPVEKINPNPGGGVDYVYEVIAPENIVFLPDGLVTMICSDFADLRERLKNSSPGESPLAD